MDMNQLVNKPEFREQAEEVIKTEFERMVDKYGEEAKPLIEVLGTVGELMTVAHAIAATFNDLQEGAGMGVIMAFEQGFRVIAKAAIDQSGYEQDKVIAMGKDIQEMRQRIQNGLQGAVDMAQAMDAMRNGSQTLQ